MDLLPKEKWRPVFHQDKERLIAAMDRELEEKIPGVTWGFSQPISDNLDCRGSGCRLGHQHLPVADLVRVVRV